MLGATAVAVIVPLWRYRAARRWFRLSAPNASGIPAAVRAALPEANPGFYVSCSPEIAFPVNLLVGLPLYNLWAVHLSGAG